MKLIHALSDFPHPPERPVALAAGCFDGLHLGHQAVIGRAIERAQEMEGEAWVFTFSPHPAKVLDPRHAPPLILAPDQQLRLFQEAGLDGCIRQPFTAEFIEQPPEAFFDLLCRSIPSLAALCVGKDWSFGRDRAGDVRLLARLCAECDIALDAIPPVLRDGKRISSTRIRAAVAEGDLDEARAMLGRPLSSWGSVVPGEGIGRRLGFPTANIRPENELLPPRGIYAARLRVGRTFHPAAAYLGRRATLHADHPTVLEVHVLDAPSDFDLYGRTVELFYLKRIREDRAFESIERLRVQIAEDIRAIRAALAEDPFPDSLV